MFKSGGREELDTESKGTRTWSYEVQEQGRCVSLGEKEGKKRVNTKVRISCELCFGICL